MDVEEAQGRILSVSLPFPTYIALCESLLIAFIPQGVNCVLLDECQLKMVGINWDSRARLPC